MSDSDSFNEALDALYKAAKASANLVEAALTSKDSSFDLSHKERLKVALSVLKITWLGEDDDEDEDEDEDDEDDESQSPYTSNNN